MDCIEIIPMTQKKILLFLKIKKSLKYLKRGHFPKSLNLFYFILIDHLQSYNEDLPNDLHQLYSMHYPVIYGNLHLNA